MLARLAQQIAQKVTRQGSSKQLTHPLVLVLVLPGFASALTVLLSGSIVAYWLRGASTVHGRVRGEARGRARGQVTVLCGS
jgi:hypothetical protein